MKSRINFSVSKSSWACALALALPMSLVASAAHAKSSWVSTDTRTSSLGLETASHLGALTNGETLHIAVGLQLHDRAGLDAFNAELTRPGSPAFGAILSSEQFMERHAPSEAEAQAVADYLTRQGFVNVEIAENRLLVSADGSAATIRSAFNTELEKFSVDGRTVFANTRDAQVPKSLSGIVQSIIGLQNVFESHTMHHVADTSTAVVRGNAATAVGHNPTTFPTIYGVGSTPSGSKTAVGIISEGDMTQTLTDFSKFCSLNSLSCVTPTVVIAGSAGTDTSGTVEWDLDSQSIVGMAGSVKSLTFYTATSLSDSALTTAYNKVISANAVKVVNVSLGECENSAKSSGVESTDDAIFASAVSLGITFSVSSGDSGSAECGRRTAGQSYPAVSPSVIAMGGTTLYTTNTTTYSSESVWSGTGGGPSQTESQPAFQKGYVTCSSCRAVPDLAMDADPASGALLVYKTNTAYQVGGTSLSSPLFVGSWARFQSANSNTLVFPATAIYQYATSKAMFYDVTSGNNGGYTASTGWDYTTGWGSIKLATDNSVILSTSGF